MHLFTIGFTKKSAEQFFTRLCGAGVSRVVDVRLNNVSQLAGFSKRDDLRYFLKAICKVDYVHVPELAPSQEMLDEYKKHSHDWRAYEQKYISLISQRKVESVLSREVFDGGCLLCSEHEPEHCHRRLAAEYLKEKWGDIDILHL